MIPLLSSMFLSHLNKRSHKFGVQQSFFFQRHQAKRSRMSKNISTWDVHHELKRQITVSGRRLFNLTTIMTVMDGAGEEK